MVNYSSPPVNLSEINAELERITAEVQSLVNSVPAGFLDLPLTGAQAVGTVGFQLKEGIANDVLMQTSGYQTRVIGINYPYADIDLSSILKYRWCNCVGITNVTGSNPFYGISDNNVIINNCAINANIVNSIEWDDIDIADCSGRIISLALTNSPGTAYFANKGIFSVDGTHCSGVLTDVNVLSSFRYMGEGIAYNTTEQGSIANITNAHFSLLGQISDATEITIPIGTMDKLVIQGIILQESLPLDDSFDVLDDNGNILTTIPIPANTLRGNAVVQQLDVSGLVGDITIKRTAETPATGLARYLTNFGAIGYEPIST